MSDYEISEWIIILTSKSATHLNSHLLQSQKGNNYCWVLDVLACCRVYKRIVNERLIDDC